MTASKPKILVIRGGAIGDFILTLPAIAALRQRFPQAHFEVLGYPHIAQLALAGGLVDRVQPIEAGPLAGFFARGGQLAPHWTDYFSEFDLIVSYLFDPDEIFQTNVARCSPAQFVVGPHRPNEAERIHATKVYLRPLERLAIFDADAVPRLRVGQASRLSLTASPEGTDQLETGGTPILHGSPGKLEIGGTPVLRASPEVPVFTPYDSESPVGRYGRHLPHWRQAGATYFVTFRLGDSIPAEKLTQWEAEMMAWLRQHPEPHSPEDRQEFCKLFTERFHKWLDAGFGECWLRDPRCSAVIEGAMRHFDGERYTLGSFVVMPNHVHALVRPAGECTLPEILHSWKSFSAHELNKLLRRRGRVWQDESFDHIVRNETNLERFERYIHENPSRAGLKMSEYRLGCGSGGKLRESAKAANGKSETSGTPVLHASPGKLETGGTPVLRTLAIHPGSGSERKNWPEAKWAELLQRFSGSTDLGLLLVGGEAEGERLQRLAAALPPARVKVAQSLPLAELARLLQDCAAFIGHDSGISHLAAALGLPGIVLWGDTAEEIWRPPHEAFIVVKSGGGLEMISVEQVVKEMAGLLRAGNR